MCPITSECGTAAVDLHCEFPFTIIPRCSIQREKSSSPYMEYLGTRIGEFQWQNPSEAFTSVQRPMCSEISRMGWGEGGKGEGGEGESGGKGVRDPLNINLFACS